jgi:hypothetical protein
VSPDCHAARLESGWLAKTEGEQWQFFVVHPHPHPNLLPSREKGISGGYIRLLTGRDACATNLGKSGSNPAAIQLLKEYMSSEIGVEDGELAAMSKGMHLYEYCWDLAKAVVNR